MSRGPVKTECRLQGPEGIGEFTLRRSRRAKSVLLRLNPVQGLMVVAPWGMNVSLLPGILERRRDWIERTRRQQNLAREQAGAMDAPFPPEITFPALGMVFRVEYVHGPGAGARILDRKTALEVVTPDWNWAAAALRAYSRAMARRRLPGLLYELAERFQVRVSKVSIRSQKSRWGSCSSRGCINLNWKLLFLAPELCGYVLLHELAHPIHLIHSREYWERVALGEPRARELDRRLRQGWAQVPHWAEELSC